MFNSLQPHGLQHARLPCPLPIIIIFVATNIYISATITVISLVYFLPIYFPWIIAEGGDWYCFPLDDSSVQSLSRVQLCNPMDCSMPGFPVHHQLPELAQTHVHQVSDAIQLSHPLSSPSPPAFSLSQHQGLFSVSQFFASGSQSIRASASFLPMNIQD